MNIFVKYIYVYGYDRIKRSSITISPQREELGIRIFGNKREEIMEIKEK